MRKVRACGLAVFILLLCSSAWGQIEIAPSTPVGEKIVAKVTLTGVPEGAELKGVAPFVSGFQWDYGPTPNIIHIWGKPGTYSLNVIAQWGIRDKEKPASWSDFGMVVYQAEFKITGGTGPNPPLPPPPGGKYQVVFWYLENQLDNLPQGQRDILRSLVFRDWLRSQGHVLLEELDPTNFGTVVPEKWVPWLNSISGKTLPAVSLWPIEGGNIVGYSLPQTTEAMKAFLAAPAGKAVRR